MYLPLFREYTANYTKLPKRPLRPPLLIPDAMQQEAVNLMQVMSCRTWIACRTLDFAMPVTLDEAVADLFRSTGFRVREITLVMDNHMEKNMQNEMESGIT